MPSFDMPLADLRRYQPPLTREPDFASFWQQTLAEAAKLPIDAAFAPADYPIRNARLYDVRFTGWGGVRVAGWYIQPAGTGPFPAVVVYQGYTAGRGEPHINFSWALQGYAVLVVDVRGQGITPNNGPYTSGHVYGWMTEGILDPREYYYRGVYTDCVRALDALATRPEVDMKHVAITGVSQGGGLTLSVAGLDHRPVAAMADVPFLCHFERAVDVAEVNPYLEIANFIRMYPQHERQVFRTLSYFDSMNLAPEVRCPTLVAVGLVDKCCPPSSIFGTFNNLACTPKEIRVYRYHEHVDVLPHFRHKLAWAQRYLVGA